MPAEGRENHLLKKGNSDAFFREKYLTKNTWRVYRFVSRRITVSPLTLRFIALQIREHPSQLVSIANVQIKSAQRSVIRL